LYQEIPYVCDLCDGDPRCIKECNLGAIFFEPEKREVISLREWAKRNRGLSTEEKRLHFIQGQSDPLRKSWILLRRS
jgi:ferredoxin